MMIYQLLEPGFVMNRVPNLDEYLEMVGFWRKLVPRDGRCLFRSLGEQLFGTQTVADELLDKCAAHLEENSDKFLRHLSHPVDQYLTSVRKAQTCAAHPHLDVFLEIVSGLYNCNIVVYHQSAAQPTCIWTKSKQPRTIQLCKIGKHYDTVMSRDRVSAYAQCQSLLFDLLYSSVFQMPDDEIDFGISALRHKVNKRKDSTSEMCMENADDSGHGGESELSPNKMPFSYRAAKGLDINIFRNIAFDIWREENLDRAVGDQLLIPGNQCIVQLSDIAEDDSLVESEAIIQDFDDENQIVSVFVQSLGMRVEVAREAVKSVCDKSPNGMAMEMVRSSNKRKYGVKQDVHWHNRPEQQQKHYTAPNVVYWPNTSVSSYTSGLDTSASERQQTAGPLPATQATGFHPGIRRVRERGLSDCSSQGHLTVQVSPGAFAAAAHQAGYPVAQVPPLMASPSRGEHPGGPQGGATKPLAKVYFNSVGKPAVCKLQLPRYTGTGSHKKSSVSEGSQDFNPDMSRGKDTPVRPSFSTRQHTSSSESAAVSSADVRSPVVSCTRPMRLTSSQPLMPMSVASQTVTAPQPSQPTTQGLEMMTGVQLLPYMNVPFVGNLAGPVDMSVDFSKDAMGRDLPQADPSTMRYFFNLGIQYFRMSVSQAPLLSQPPPTQPGASAHWMPVPNLQCAPPAPPHSMGLPGTPLNPQHRSSPVSGGQSVRVVPLMDIEHAQQQQQQPPQQQSQAPQPPHMPAGNLTSLGGMIFAPCSSGLAPSQPVGSFPGSVYVGPSYYPVTAGGPCPVHGLEGAPVLGASGGVGSEGMSPMVAPPQIGAPQSWAPTAYCYI